MFHQALRIILCVATLWLRGLALPLALDDFGGETDVGLTACAIVIVEQDWLAVRGCLTEFYISWDLGAQNGVFKMFTHIDFDLMRKIVSAVEHCQQYALDIE